MPLDYIYGLSRSEIDELCALMGVDYQVNDELHAGGINTAAVVRWVNEKLQSAFDEGRRVG